MPKIVILNIGERYGKWTLIAPAEMHVARSGKTEKQWLCRCDCGITKVIQQAKLRSGETLSCGCWRNDDDERITAETIGKKFGRLTIVAAAERHIRTNGKRRRQWLCQCDCGNTVVTVLCKLTTGHTRSCGCWSADRRLKHGHNKPGQKSSTYSVWDAMHQRCLNPNSTKFWQYGAVGITVCDRWRSFENFLADMGERPSRGHSIDRYPNQQGNYEPNNCRWATRKEQARNIRTNHIVEYHGRTMSVAEAAELAGVSGNKLYPLLNHRGMSIDEAIWHVGG